MIILIDGANQSVMGYTH